MLDAFRRSVDNVEKGVRKAALKRFLFRAALSSSSNSLRFDTNEEFELALGE